MRVGGQTPTTDLPPKAVKLGLAQPPFKIRAGIHPRSTVPLVEHEIARVPVLCAAKKIIKPDVV